MISLKSAVSRVLKNKAEQSEAYLRFSVAPTVTGASETDLIAIFGRKSHALKLFALVLSEESNCCGRKLCKVLSDWIISLLPIRKSLPLVQWDAVSISLRLLSGSEEGFYLEHSLFLYATDPKRNPLGEEYFRYLEAKREKQRNETIEAEMVAGFLAERKALVESCFIELSNLSALLFDPSASYRAKNSETLKDPADSIKGAITVEIATTLDYASHDPLVLDRIGDCLRLLHKQKEKLNAMLGEGAFLGGFSPSLQGLKQEILLLIDSIGSVCRKYRTNAEELVQC